MGIVEPVFARPISVPPDAELMDALELASTTKDRFRREQHEIRSEKLKVSSGMYVMIQLIKAMCWGNGYGDLIRKRESAPYLIGPKVSSQPKQIN